MSQPKDFSADEWSLVKRTPLLAFYYVANADEKIESHEVEKLISLFSDPERYNSSFFSMVVKELMADPKQLQVTGSEILGKDIKAVHAEISSVQELLDANLAADEATAFKRALVALGTDIAAATGDAEIPVSKEEWAEVTTFKKLLKL